MSPHCLLLVLIFLLLQSARVGTVSCSSDSYCPAGWSILRRADSSATTCDPTDRERPKCPKPFMCIASKCGLKFCCASDKMLRKYEEMDEVKRDAESAEDEREL